MVNIMNEESNAAAKRTKRNLKCEIILLFTILSINIILAADSTSVTGLSDLMKLICLLLTSILPILVFLLFVLAAILYGLSGFFDSETKAKMKKWSMATLISSIIILVIYLIAPIIIGLLTGTEFCTLCECKAGFTKVCPPGSNICPPGINCPSGCCKDNECILGTTSSSDPTQFWYAPNGSTICSSEIACESKICKGSCCISECKSEVEATYIETPFFVIEVTDVSGGIEGANISIPLVPVSLNFTRGCTKDGNTGVFTCNRTNCTSGCCDQNGNCIGAPPAPVSCPSGSHWDDTKKCCVFDSKPDTCIPSCPTGMEYNVLTGMCCVIGDPTKCCPLGSLYKDGKCCLISDPTKCCPLGTSWNETKECCFNPITNNCIGAPTAPVPCPSGSHWDDTKKCCVFDSKPDTCIPSCLAGMEYNVLTGMCCVIEDPTKCCPLGTSWNETRGCCVDFVTNNCVYECTKDPTRKGCPSSGIGGCDTDSCCPLYSQGWDETQNCCTDIFGRCMYLCITDISRIGCPIEKKGVDGCDNDACCPFGARGWGADPKDPTKECCLGSDGKCINICSENPALTCPSSSGACPSSGCCPSNTKWNDTSKCCISDGKCVYICEDNPQLKGCPSPGVDACQLNKCCPKDSEWNETQNCCVDSTNKCVEAKPALVTTIPTGSYWSPITGAAGAFLSLTDNSTVNPEGASWSADKEYYVDPQGEPVIVHPSGYSDCNNDGKYECITTSPSGSSWDPNTGAFISPFDGKIINSQGTHWSSEKGYYINDATGQQAVVCPKGYSDCNNDGICECNTAAKHTCCLGKCITGECRCPEKGAPIPTETGLVDCGYFGERVTCFDFIACSINNCVAGWKCADPRLPEGSCKTEGACTTSEDCCCGYQCSGGICCVAGQWRCYLSCTTSTDCSAGQTCDNPTSLPLGGKCVSTT